MTAAIRLVPAGFLMAASDLVRAFPGLRPLARRISAELLPRPAPVSASMPADNQQLVLAGMFRTANGLGEAARLNYYALRDAGFSPVCFDLSEAFDQIDHETSIPLARSISPNHCAIIIHTNPPEFIPAIQALGIRRWHRTKLIGYWLWELSAIPTSWEPALDLVSEVWAPSTFVSEAFLKNPHVQQKKLHISIVPCPVRVPSVPETAPEYDKTHPLRVLVMADGRSSLQRKNIFGAIRIFQRSFSQAPQSATLTVKTRNLAEFPQSEKQLQHMITGWSNISLVNKSMSDSEKWQMFRAHDVLLSAHRAEGFGLHLAEGMALGKCVMATGWSGNLQFMESGSSVSLPFELVDVADSDGVYASEDDSNLKWAAVDEEAAARQLALLAEDRQSLRAIGKAAPKAIARNLAPDSLLSETRRLLGLKPTTTG
ncbi:MAG: glycosyltransferase [Henriciella sp.]|uniref:hypothetical protein n=1 Tax=Henriciella sp. TaxID=1968823 RepID=UPI003C7167EB